MKYEFKEMDFCDIYLIYYPSFGKNGRISKKIYELKENNILYDVGFNPCESMFLHSDQGVLRGMHYQSIECNRQNRLLYVLRGTVFIVVVDLKEGRKTYGLWQSMTISENDNTCLYVPGDYAIGTLANEDSDMIMFYDGEYQEGFDCGFRYDDASLGIKWGLSVDNIQIAEKDLKLPSFKNRMK